MSDPFSAKSHRHYVKPQVSFPKDARNLPMGKVTYYYESVTPGGTNPLPGFGAS
jgi:hypothetical protein